MMIFKYTKERKHYSLSAAQIQTLARRTLMTQSHESRLPREDVKGLKPNRPELFQDCLGQCESALGNKNGL